MKHDQAHEASSIPRREGSPRRATTEAGVDLSTTNAPASPTLPHERDQSVGMTDGAPSQRVQQGSRDLKRGVQDTSGAPEADDAYRKLKKK